MRWIAGYTTVTGDKAINFNTIDQSYTHLQVRINGRCTGAVAAASSYFILPGAASSWTQHSMESNGSSTISWSVNVGLGGYTTLAAITGASAATGSVSSIIIDILDYTNPNKNYVVKSFGGYNQNTATTGQIITRTHQAPRVAAISTIQIDCDYSWVPGSRIDVYGITSNPIATGA
jgi:hypothetical protein